MGNGEAKVTRLPFPLNLFTVTPKGNNVKTVKNNIFW